MQVILHQNVLKPSRSSHLLPQSQGQYLLSNTCSPVSSQRVSAPQKEAQPLGDEDSCDSRHLSDASLDEDETNEGEWDSKQALPGSFIQGVKRMSVCSDALADEDGTVEEQPDIQQTQQISQHQLPAKTALYNSLAQSFNKRGKLRRQESCFTFSSQEGAPQTTCPNSTIVKTVEKVQRRTPSQFLTPSNSSAITADQNSLVAKKYQQSTQKQQYLQASQHTPHSNNTGSQPTTPLTEEARRQKAQSQQLHVKRLSEHARVIEEKRAEKARVKDNEEMRECTFTPTINSYGAKRTLDEFLDLQNQFSQYVKEKKKALQEHNEESANNELTLKPRILSKSRHLAEKSGKLSTGSTAPIPVHARLYYVNRRSTNNLQKLMGDEDKENTFKPNIQSKSKNIVRAEKIDDLLYADAKRRSEVQRKHSEFKRSQSSKYLSSQSEKILEGRFVKELEQTISQLANEPNIDAQGRTYFDVATLFEILIKTGFVRYSTTNEVAIAESEKKIVFLIWSLLATGNEQYILRENLQVFLLALLNIDSSGVEQSYLKSYPAATQDNQSSNQTQNRHTRSKSTWEGEQGTSNKKFAKVLALPSEEGVFAAFPNSKAVGEARSRTLSPATIQDIPKNLRLGIFLSNGLLCLEEDDRRVVRKAFELLYRNRLAYEELHTQKQNWEHSFKPQISELSRQLASQHRERLLQNYPNSRKSYDAQKVTHEELLLWESKVVRQQRERRANEQAQRELQECSFHPKISNFDFSQCFARKKGRLTDHSAQNACLPRDEHSSLCEQNAVTPCTETQEECTFKPNILQSQLSLVSLLKQKSREVLQHPDTRESVNKSVERMRKARQEHERVRKLKERGFASASDLALQKQFAARNTQNKPAFYYQCSSQSSSCSQTQQEFSKNTTKRLRRHQRGSYFGSQSFVGGANEQQQFQQPSVEERLPVKNQRYSAIASQQVSENSSPVVSQNNNFTTPSAAKKFRLPGSHLVTPAANGGTNNNTNNNNNSNKAGYHLPNNALHTTQQIPNTSSSRIPIPLSSPDHTTGLHVLQRFQESLTGSTTSAQSSAGSQKFALGGGNSQEVPIDSEEINKLKSTAQVLPTGTNQSEEKTPLLFVDVNLGNGRTERIIVFEGDSAQDLAERFSQQHGLDATTKQKFRDLLESQISGLLSRIEEEGDEDCSMANASAHKRNYLFAQ